MLKIPPLRTALTGFLALTLAWCGTLPDWNVSRAANHREAPLDSRAWFLAQHQTELGQNQKATTFLEQALAANPYSQPSHAEQDAWPCSRCWLPAQKRA